MVKRVQVLSMFAALAAALVLAGCGDSEDVTRLGSDDLQNEVGASTLQAAVLAPSATAAAEAALELMSLFSAGAPAALADAAIVPQCPASFTLPIGLTGNCSVSDGGVVTIEFQGSAGGVSLAGTLVATPAATQPPSGSAWTVEFEVTASAPGGARTWEGVGNVVLDASGNPLDYDWTLTTSASGGGGTVNVAVDPSAVRIVASGPLGNVVRFDLDRQTSGGTVSVNGEIVAVIVFSDGCAIVDFADARLGRQEICPEG